MNKQQGFSLIELLIVVAIIAIIAAIAVPSMLTSRMAANEAGAIQGCRTIGSAEVAFAAVNNQAYSDIDALVDGQFLDERFSNDAGFNGYVYAAGDAMDAPDVFAFNSNPKTEGSTGRYNYAIGVDQVVRYGDKHPEGIETGAAIGQQASSGS
jgi:prepilin-type N-terminal cleavage/methylation domain-containing protein